MPMKNPPHPGLSVKHDCLEPLGLTVTEGARILGVSRKALSDLVNGHAGISPEMAIRLSKAFGSRPEVWHGIQADYDMVQAMKNADRIKVQRIDMPTPRA
jgi:addiction module HigA family antidote